MMVGKALLPTGVQFDNKAEIVPDLILLWDNARRM
jgi:hypothetical protein